MVWHTHSIFTNKTKEKKWTGKQKECLLKGEVKTVISNIKRIGKNSETANQLINYYCNNKDRMKYQEYAKIGCGIIGSGAIESAHRTLVQKAHETIWPKVELARSAAYA